jgi:hypothetical protein
MYASASRALLKGHRRQTWTLADRLAPHTRPTGDCSQDTSSKSVDPQRGSDADGRTVYDLVQAKHFRLGFSEPMQLCRNDGIQLICNALKCM